IVFTQHQTVFSTTTPSEAFMRRDLQGRRILITGASSGIGEQLARQLATEGAKLVLAARSQDKLRQLAQALPGEILVVPTDLTKEADRQNVLDQAVQHFGGLDVLINNAGIASWAHF